MAEYEFNLKKIVDFFNPPQKTEYVAQSDTMLKALTIMNARDFSQILVVKQNPSNDLYDKQIAGFLSWYSIGRKIMNNPLKLNDPVELYMEKRSESKYMTVSHNALLADVARDLQTKEYVLATEDSGKVLGFVTTYDISQVYLDLVLPYTGIQKIEHILRKRLEKLSTEELEEACCTSGHERKVTQVDQMEFAEYSTVFRKKWDKVGYKCDKSVFFELLNEVREARNKIMHFNTNQLTASERNLVNSFCNILQE